MTGERKALTADTSTFEPSSGWPLLPPATVLAVLGLVEVLSRQPLLISFLAWSAFLIHLDPRHGTKAVRTLVLA